MQAFRSRDLKGLVAWQTAYYPEGVGIDEGKTLRFIGKARNDTDRGGMSLVEVDYDARGSVICGFAGVPDRFGCAFARALRRCSGQSGGRFAAAFKASIR